MSANLFKIKTSLEKIIISFGQRQTADSASTMKKRRSPEISCFVLQTLRDVHLRNLLGQSKS